LAYERDLKKEETNLLEAELEKRKKKKKDLTEQSKRLEDVKLTGLA